MDTLHPALLLIAQDGQNVSARLAELLSISRQAASAQLTKLKRAGIIDSHGHGRGTVYDLVTLHSTQFEYQLDGLDEENVWRETLSTVVAHLPQNVRDIWHYGFTEMVNNAIDHSGSDRLAVSVGQNAVYTFVAITDEGEGIFGKIQRALGLYDPREAILELTKGKFTTDPANHSGEGIFFSSKMFDCFDIQSGELLFQHDAGAMDILTDATHSLQGTRIYMRLRNDSQLHDQEVFDRFAAPEEFTFAHTLVPVRLAQHEGEKLVSRSQAKRLTRRFERFLKVVLDFEGVEEIGQGFADEVFRVFQRDHPDTLLVPMNTSAAVEAMIRHVRPD